MNYFLITSGLFLNSLHTEIIYMLVFIVFIIGVSLSEPHPGVTALHVHACLLRLNECIQTFHEDCPSVLQLTFRISESDGHMTRQDISKGKRYLY